MKYQYFVQSPDAHGNFSYDLLFGYAAYGAAAAVNRSFAVVTHQKIPGFRDLIGVFQIAFSQGLLRDIRLVQNFAVDIYCADIGDADIVRRPCEHALDKQFVADIKGNQVAPPEFRAFDGNHVLTFLQSGSHGRSVNLKYRHPQSRHQNSQSGHHDQTADGTAQRGAIAEFIPLTPKLLF